MRLREISRYCMRVKLKCAPMPAKQRTTLPGNSHHEDKHMAGSAMYGATESSRGNSLDEWFTELRPASEYQGREASL